MLKEVKIKVDDITKIKEFTDCVVIYTIYQYWVCVKEQPIPTKKDIFVTLRLKGKSER